MSDFDVEGDAVSENGFSQEASRFRGFDCVRETLSSERVLPAQVDVSALAAGRESCDGHRLDEREGIGFHEHAILESPGLRLVGVAHKIHGPIGRVPLLARGEGRSASPNQPRGDDFPHHPIPAQRHGSAQSRVAAVGAIVVEAFRIDASDPPQQHQFRLAGLRSRDLCVKPVRGLDCKTWLCGAQRLAHFIPACRGKNLFAGVFSGKRQQRRRRALAES